MKKDGDGITQASKDGFGLFKELKARNASTLARQDMTEETRRFYDRAARIQDQEGVPDDVALVKARERTAAAAENGEPVNLRLRDEDILRKLQSSQSGWLPFSSAPANLTEILPVVRNRIRENVTDGMSEDEAVKEASEWTSKSFVEVHGNYTRISGQVPTDFKAQAESILGEYYNSHGRDEGLDNAKDLTIRRSGSENRWIVVNKRTRLPVTHGTPGERSFDILGIGRWRTLKARDNRQENAWETWRNMALPSITEGQ